MAIVYTKFLEMLKERNISIYQLKTDKVIGTATIDKLEKNEGHIDTRSIDRICRYLNCQPGIFWNTSQAKRGIEPAFGG